MTDQLPIAQLPTLDVEVKLIGEDGNAFLILGSVEKAMRRAGIDQETRDLYNEQATSGDYDHLLAVTYQMVDIV